MNDPPAAFSPPALIREAHDTSEFCSGEPVLDDWLRRRAVANLRLAASRTYVVCPAGSLRVVGFFSLSMGQILAQEVTCAMRRNMPRAIPAVVLGRLAIDQGWQGRGLGRAMLAEVVRRTRRAGVEISVRLVIVHAISPAAEAFYQHHGFARLPVATPTFALDLLKFERMDRGTA